MATRRSYAGGAVRTTLVGTIASSGGGTVVITSAAGWPDGSGGPFAVVVDRGTASAEKILVSSRSGTTLTYTAPNRGWDGTAAVAHLAGAAIELCLTGVDLDEANDHIADITNDDHTQYLNNARHDITARHAFGAALGTPGAAADIGTAAAAGSGGVPARQDHVHKLGNGSINAPALFAAGAVDAAALASNAVTTAKITDANVTNAKLANGAIANDAKLATGLRIPVTCTSSTRPGSPSIGDRIYETDTGELLIYCGATTGWQRPWRLPWGLIAIGTSVADITNIGTGGTLIASVTFTAVANRRYRVSGRVRASAASVVLTSFAWLELSASTDLDIVGATHPASSSQVTHRPEYVGTLTAGSRTLDLRVNTDTGTVTSAAGATYPAFITVEDIGPLTSTPPVS